MIDLSNDFIFLRFKMLKFLIIIGNRAHKTSHTCLKFDNMILAILESFVDIIIGNRAHKVSSLSW